MPSKTKFYFPKYLLLLCILYATRCPADWSLHYPVPVGKNQLRAQVSRYSQLPGFSQIGGQAFIAGAITEVAENGRG